MCKRFVSSNYANVSPLVMPVLSEFSYLAINRFKPFCAFSLDSVTTASSLVKAAIFISYSLFNTNASLYNCPESRSFFFVIELSFYSISNFSIHLSRVSFSLCNIILPLLIFSNCCFLTISKFEFES